MITATINTVRDMADLSQRFKNFSDWYGATCEGLAQDAMLIFEPKIYVILTPTVNNCAIASIASTHPAGVSFYLLPRGNVFQIRNAIADYLRDKPIITPEIAQRYYF